MDRATVGSDFERRLHTAFAEGDREGKETLVLLFGQDGNVSDMIVPDQQGEPYSVELTETGSLDLACWQAQHAEKNLIGWAHSHHTLSTVPSVVDVRQQYLYQTENAKIIMVIKNIDGPTKAWRLRQEAMEQLESLDGNAPHGTEHRYPSSGRGPGDH